MRVSTPEGEWIVRRRWAPRFLGRATPMQRLRRNLPGERKRRRQAAGKGDGRWGAPDILGAPIEAGLEADNPLVGLAVGAAIAIAAAVAFLAIIFVAPLLVAAVEILVLVVIAALGGLIRLLFRRPWIVDAVSPHGVHHEHRVVGWERSGAVRDFIAESVHTTGTMPAVAELDLVSSR